MAARRKGFMQDLVTVLRIVPMLAITLLVAGLLHTRLSASGQLRPGPMQSVGTALQIMDLAPAFLVVGLFVAALVLANRLGAHPAALGVSFLMLGIVVYVAAIYADLWLVIVNQPAFKPVVNTFPLTHRIMEYFPMLIGVFGLIGIYVMYRLGGDGGGRRAPL